MIRRWLRGEGGSVTGSPRHGMPVAQGPGDDRRTPLPGRPRLSELPTRPAPETGLRVVALPVSSDGREFRADRRSARYATSGAVLVVADRPLAVATVSLSGLSVEWGGAALPAVGTVLEGLLRPAGRVGEFPVSFTVVRLEPHRRLVAGRFAGLKGSAIDALLAWLVRLDRGAAQG